MIRIKIPLPLSPLRAQNSGNWRGKAGAVKAYRELARLAVLEQVGAIETLKNKVKIHHAWWLGSNPHEKLFGRNCPTGKRAYRPQDEGNAIQALKPAIDGLVDSRLLADDRANFVAWGEYTRHTKHGGASYVELILEPIPGSKVNIDE